MNIGVIGYGNRMNKVIEVMQKCDSDFNITSVTDVRNEVIKKEIEASGKSCEAITFYDNADEMLSNEDLDGVCIGTRCSLHTSMTLKALQKRLPIYLEKPVATNMSDLLKLRNAYNKYKKERDDILVGFNQRTTPLLTSVKEIIDSDKLGTIEHVQAVNNVPYGGVYFHSWYRDEDETGGLFLQKATHDLDYINFVLGLKPVRVCAMISKQIYKGNKPANLMCKDCSDQETCTESPANLEKAFEQVRGPYCCFAADTGNEDSGSALIQYESGMHVVYSQNFFARKKAASRGARFFGYKGTLDFDWYTGEIKLYMHHTPRVEIHKFDIPQTFHSGGDLVLASNFINILKGREKTVASLEAVF